MYLFFYKTPKVQKEPLRVRDAISFGYYDCLCMTEPKKLLTIE